MVMGPNERRLKEKTTTEVAMAQIGADLDAARNKTARLREQRLTKEAEDKAAAERQLKPKRRSRSKLQVPGSKGHQTNALDER